jgi:hypothetical protein
MEQLHTIIVHRATVRVEEFLLFEELLDDFPSRGDWGQTDPHGKKDDTACLRYCKERFYDRAEGRRAIGGWWRWWCCEALCGVGVDVSS